jgi:hypothetical protein
VYLYRLAGFAFFPNRGHSENFLKYENLSKVYYLLMAGLFCCFIFESSNLKEQKMVKSSEKSRWAAVLALAAVVVSFGMARMLWSGLPGTPAARGHGWGMPYGAGLWEKRLTAPEAERGILFEKGMYGPQAFSQHLGLLKEQRPAVLAFLAIGALGIIVLGIVAFAWIDRQAKTVNAVCAGDGEKTAGALRFFLLGIITFGIYNLWWLYMLGERLQNNAPRYHLSFKESGASVLLWFTLGACILVGPLIALYTIVKNTNALAAEHDKAVPQENASISGISCE